MKRLEIRRSAAQSGSVLIATVAVVAAVALIMAAVLTQGRAMVQYSSQQVDNKQLYYASMAGLAQVRHFIGTASYNNNGNSWLQDSNNMMNNGSVTPAPPVSQLAGAIRLGQPIATANPSLQRFETGETITRVYLYNIGQGLFQAISTAEHKKTHQVHTRAMNIRERASFARYIFFREDSLNFGLTTTAGDVHSNNLIRFFEPFHSYGPITTINGFAYFRNAIGPGNNDANVFFHDTADGGSEERDRPDVQDLQSLESGVLAEDSPYMIKSSPDATNFWRLQHNLTTIDAVKQMHFDLHEVKIQVEGRDAGGLPVTSPVVTLPLPSEGLIYTDRQVQSLEGRLSGRVTLAVDYGNSESEAPSPTNESVRLTGPLVYEDSNGEHPYELHNVTSDGQLGTRIDDIQSTPQHVPWTESNGYLYEKNPSYLQNAQESIPPVMGIIAKGQIRVTEDAPHNMVFHAATISVNSAWTTTYHESLTSGSPSLNQLRKGNWRHLGAKVAKGGGGRYLFSGVYPYPGYSASGEYLYDSRLRSTPPPHFLGEDRPSFGPAFAPEKGTVSGL